MLFTHMVEYKLATDDTLSLTLKALSDPTRRKILSQLSGGEKRVTELAKPIEMSLNSVSKHIKTLEASGLVKRRREGREHFLMVVPDQLDQATQWLLSQRAAWNTRLDRLETLLAEGDEDDSDG